MNKHVDGSAEKLGLFQAVKGKLNDSHTTSFAEKKLKEPLVLGLVSRSDD